MIVKERSKDPRVSSRDEVQQLLEQRLLDQSLFVQSLLKPAVTSGRNANCFFQSFMHVFTRLPNKTLSQLLQDLKHRLSLHHLAENFNRAYSKLLPRTFNLREIVEFSKTLHPLDRELAFGPVLRATYNTLVEAQLVQAEPLELDEHNIVLSHQTTAFANCFGACLSVYMSEDEFDKAQLNGMPRDVADRVSNTKVVVGKTVYVCDREVNQPCLWDLNLVYSGIHLNYTHGTSELNQQERKQVITSQNSQGAYFASDAINSDSAPLFSASTQDILTFRMVKLFRQFDIANNPTKLLSVNTGPFRRLGNGFLEKHRHDDSRIQHEYDKRFGLTVKQ